MPSDMYWDVSGVFRRTDVLSVWDGAWKPVVKAWIWNPGSASWRVCYDTAVLGVLDPPTWDGGSPSGFTSGGVGHISFAFSNPDALAETQLWMNDGSSDGGTWSLAHTFAAGSGGDTLAVTDVSGVSTGDIRWFYLKAKRIHYTTSAESDHAMATWGDTI